MSLRPLHCLLALLLVSSANAESRVFVSLAGTLLEAEITAVQGDIVTLKRANDGQSLNVPKQTLCKEDHAYIASWVEQTTAPAAAPASPPTATPNNAATPFQKFSLTVQSLPSKNNQSPASSPERIYETAYTFHISNREVKRNLEGAKAVVVTLGRNAADTGGDLVVLQKAQFDLTIQAQAKTTITTSPMHLVYSPEYRYGVRSHGYILFIVDAGGNVLFSESTPDGNTKFWKEISELSEEPPLMVDREFKRRPGIEALSSYVRF